MQKPYGIHWFRRDLRVAGNPALSRNFEKNAGRVVGLFVFDKLFLSRPDFSANRFQFFLETLRALRQELRTLGSDLLVLDVGPDEAFKSLFERLPVLPSLVTWNRDYEPFARERDAKREAWLQARGIAYETDRDHLLIEPHEILKGDGSTYQVFTPFSRRWLEVFATDEVQSRVQRQKKGLKFLEGFAKGGIAKLFSLDWSALGEATGDVLERYLASNGKKVTVPIPPAGSQAALAALKTFAPKIEDYGEARDMPSVAGTSALSIYFKNGSLTVAQAIARLGLGAYRKQDKSGKAKWMSELIWREFYYHILFHHPRVEKTAFLEKYADLKWSGRLDWFQAWKDGLTGFPIVDAGMRQLKQTGWMHNRVRMIVASFFTKDLLLDWRWGERYFMETLLDGDLAPNNGGWQWAASTGCDPQPYFRVFNPKLQGEKFDPQGLYVKKYVPELAHFCGKNIHDPQPHERGHYPGPIVDHAEQRDEAIALYRVDR